MTVEDEKTQQKIAFDNTKKTKIIYKKKITKRKSREFFGIDEPDL